MRAMIAGSVLLALAGCGGPSDAERAAQERADEAAIAQVEEHQIAPPLDIELEPIGYDDIVKNAEMEGTGCSFYGADDEDPIAILGDSLGFVKVSGTVQRLAADAGSAQGPAGTRITYDGREYALRIEVDEAAKEDGEGEGTFVAPASIRLVDGYDRDLAAETGRVGCGG